MAKDILRIGNRIVNNPTYNNNEYGLQFGVSGSGNSSIQTYVYDQSQSSIVATYNLLLQPSGGNIGIGTTEAHAPLTVFGIGGSLTGGSYRTYFHAGNLPDNTGTGWSANANSDDLGIFSDKTIATRNSIISINR